MAEFDESEHPRGKGGKFTHKANSKADKLEEAESIYSDDTLQLPDEQLPRSLSAKWANHEIVLPDGNKVKFVEGTKLHHIEVFAGKGTKTPIRDVDRLVRQYGGKPDDWQKVKGVGIIDIDGKSEEAELHWYQTENIGKVEIKVKE